MSKGKATLAVDLQAPISLPLLDISEAAVTLLLRVHHPFVDPCRLPRPAQLSIVKAWPS
jgi:hypothetical protein